MKAPAVDAPELWSTDGRKVWRAPGGPVVCVLGDPRQGELFADVELHRLRDAQLIVCAPRLAAALGECALRLERCCHFTGTAAEYAQAAVKAYRDLLAEARGNNERAT